MSEEPNRRNNDALQEILANLDELEFGIITQRGYKKLEEKIDNHAKKVELRFSRWFAKGLIAFAVTGLLCAIALVGFGILLTKQGNLTNQIQNQRYDATVDACQDQNKRHDEVIRQIDAAVALTPSARRKQAEEGAKPFKLILEAAVPFTYDCDALARGRVQGEK